MPRKGRHATGQRTGRSRTAATRRANERPRLTRCSLPVLPAPSCPQGLLGRLKRANPFRVGRVSRFPGCGLRNYQLFSWNGPERRADGVENAIVHQPLACGRLISCHTWRPFQRHAVILRVPAAEKWQPTSQAAKRNAARAAVWGWWTCCKYFQLGNKDPSCC